MPIISRRKAIRRNVAIAIALTWIFVAAPAQADPITGFIIATLGSIGITGAAASIIAAVATFGVTALASPVETPAVRACPSTLFIGGSTGDIRARSTGRRPPNSILKRVERSSMPPTGRFWVPFWLLKIRGNCMAPRMRDGAFVIIDRQAEIRTGDLCAFSVRGMDIKASMTKQFVSANDWSMTFEMLNPPDQYTVAREDLTWCYRVTHETRSYFKMVPLLYWTW
jgi:hypothetical protein